MKSDANAPRARAPVVLALVVLSFALGAISCGARPVETAVAGSGTWLDLVDGDGKIRTRLFLPDGRFAHVYVHSINLGRVDEEFAVEPNGVLRLERLRYDQMSSGMPSESEGSFALEDGRFVLTITRSFRELPVRVSPVAGHGIQTAEGFTAFADIFDTGELVTLVAAVGKDRLPSDDGRASFRGEQ
ncbi:MAG: DUF1850 domain-containing protein [Spirochaetales bacterium]|nr:DUF1850 domain-containing protein [Spirochaetales bacterium]